MSAKNTLRDTPANPTKDSPACRGQDGCEAAQNDGSDESVNNPPNHGEPTIGISRFLWWVGRTGRSRDLEQLSRHYEDWQQQKSGCVE